MAFEQSFFFALIFLFILFLRALEDVFQMHIKSKRHNLDEVSKKTSIIKYSVTSSRNVVYQC